MNRRRGGNTSQELTWAKDAEIAWYIPKQGAPPIPRSGAHSGKLATALEAKLQAGSCRGDSCKKGAVWLKGTAPTDPQQCSVLFCDFRWSSNGPQVELGIWGLPAPLPALPDGAPAGWFAPLLCVIEEVCGCSPVLVTLLMSEQIGAVNN